MLIIEILGFPENQKISLFDDFESNFLLQSAVELRKIIETLHSGYLRCSPNTGLYSDIKIMVVRHLEMKLSREM